MNLAQTGALVANGAIRCAADYNNDGSIDHADYDDFLSAFESGGFRADFNGDFTIDFFDYQDFIIAYEGGCND